MPSSLEQILWQEAVRPGARFCVVTHGCKVNRVESDSVAAALIAGGCMPSDEDTADLIIVNTCTVTSEADRKARKAVRHALKVSPQAQIIVTGCGVAIDDSFYRSLDERVHPIMRADLLGMIASIASDSGMIRTGKDFRTRINIKVQDGCNRACTFCIVHVARGPAHSTPYDQVIAEVERYLNAGASEIVLTGIDLGSYRDGNRTLVQLIEGILECIDRSCPPGRPPARIRASSLEPVTVDESFLDLLAMAEGRVCRHLHLPLQSGSSKVLHEMARPYSAEWFSELAAHIYERIPEMSLTTDIICGFPGESDDEFSETLEMARLCRFSKIHVFPYSRREGTPAAARSDQVPDPVRAQRAASLRLLADELREQDLSRRKGTVELALVEPDQLLTESYHELPARSDVEIGSLVAVEL